MENRVFLEKSRLVEIIALKCNINSHETHQSKRKSISSMTKKASEDYRLLIHKIVFFLCHDDKFDYEKCKCKECLTLSGVLSLHGDRFFSLYDFIVKQKLDVSVEPHLVRMAILDVFILPYLIRVVNELKVKFNRNRMLWYLDKYIKFIASDASRTESPLKAFLRMHVASVPCRLYVDKIRYRAKTVGHAAEYQSWDSFVKAVSVQGDLSPGTNRWAEAFGWHCAGNMVYQVLSLMNVTVKGDVHWRDSKLTASLQNEYDFLYDSFLSLDRDMQFSLFRSDKVRFNLVINNNVECYLTLDRKSIFQKHLGEKDNFGLSFNKNTFFDVSLKHENQTQSPSKKKARFNQRLNQHSTLNLQFNCAVRVKSPSDDEAELNIVPSDDAKIAFFLDGNGQFKLLFHKDATFCLRSNKRLNIDSRFENLREHRHKEALSVFTAFKQVVSSREEKGITLTEVEEINDFCERVLNSTPAMDDIRQEEDKLKTLLKDGLNNRYTSFLAWCIFIAKSKHGKLKSGNETLYCESRILEHQDDYFNGSLAYIRQLRHRAIHADFKHDMLHRLGYIRIYNKLVMGGFEHSRPRAIDKLLILDWRTINFFQSNEPRILSFLEGDRYTGEVINPFTDIEKYIDSILRWDSCSSFKVVIDESAIDLYQKKSEEWLTWLILPNVPHDKKNKPLYNHTNMKLCRTCTVRLYPELMALVGLRHNPKYASLKEREHEKLISLLQPCQCRRINDFELAENKEAGEWEDIYYRRPICL